MPTLAELLTTLAPHLADALIAILTAATGLAVAWLRHRAQRIAAQEAALEAERRGVDFGLTGEQKKRLAMDLASQRLGPLTRPSTAVMDRYVEDAVPAAKASIRPPADDEDGESL